MGDDCWLGYVGGGVEGFVGWFCGLGGEFCC